MKKSGQSKMKVQLYEGLLVVVIIVVIVVLILAVRSDKKNIEKTFDNTLTYLKSQCLSYDEVVEADKIKSLVRLTEQAVEVGTDIHRDSELIDSVYLKNYIEAQRMAGIIILDEDMQPECQYSNVGLDYDAWKELILPMELFVSIAGIKKSARLQNILKKSMQNGFRKTKNGMIWQQYPEQTVRELYFATVIRIQTV